MGRCHPLTIMMNSPPLLKPELYTEDCTLHGGHCRCCGYAFFPLQTYGCEQCGAVDAIEAQDFPATGTLVAAAEVHVHNSPGRQAPFVVGAIRLIAGPVIRTLLVGEQLSELSPRQEMVGRIIPATDAEGKACRDLRFVAAGASA